MKKCDTDGNGKLSRAEIKPVDWSDVMGEGITSLEGVEHFVNLTERLDTCQCYLLVKSSGFA